MAITPVSELVAQAKARITTLPPDQARAMADAGDALLIDIRDVRELQREGRVPGAIHAPRGMLEFWVDPESPYHKPAFATDKTLILFCAGAMRSALAAATLQDMGVTNVAEMDEGFGGWKDRGLPVEQD
ncbi:Putative thiosulfate sulfurtransferase precursor [Rhodobacteraceae bacterium THAF1]|uniref:rhodanese-like domain-containing protein n=1 Tax=Palleronia sp. THAF1 TaxID=2587842 RepID=UPI000F41AD39|nr:rhodanese-like domain-containing protein [Palleronia sp. THAF1]QFU09906.1 Putative thiosulfate sulfurtransferase precursor [Palleronia sp. THAF1]VDC17191.1 Putative thiosulfate sulfurtransferase precursor [Rhodobacteraceae bacterium THAF1]